MTRILVTTLAFALLSTASYVANAADLWRLKEGTPDLQSAGTLAFGPDGILFVGDQKGAAVFAIATNDAQNLPSSVSLNVDDVTARLGKLFKVAAQDVAINDLAVNPASGHVFLSVTKGSGSDAAPAIVKVDAKGAFSKVSLKNVAFSKAALSNAPEDKVVKRGRRSRNPRADSITDLAYVDGKVIVSGLSAGASGSTVREIGFPFVTTDQGSRVEIYHGAHGKLEDYAAIRTFVPFNINGEPTLLAGYVCTPLVKFPLASLKPGQKTRGTTIAELGNRNRPLDMIVYEKDGKDFLLLANSARGVMKISTDNIAGNPGINERVSGTAGQPYETIESLQGVVQLDRLNATHAVVLVQGEGGSQQLKSVELP